MEDGFSINRGVPPGHRVNAMTGEILGREVATSASGARYVNLAGVPTEIAESAVNRVGRELASWVESTRGKPSLYNRTAFVPSDNPYTVMATAKAAVENDDVIGGVCDVTEGLMLQGVKWESDKPGDADIFNQIARDLNLDQFVRQWHREEFTYSQVVVGIWWGKKTYKERGETESGRKKKRSVTIDCPVGITILDPQKVIPLPPGPFGQDRLAWSATRDEAEGEAWMSDAVMQQFISGRAILTDHEKKQITKLVSNIDVNHLLMLNPERVFRHCRTKMPYEQFAVPRLKSTFPLLDMKQQLMESDRINLVGAANYILLVRQGTDESPAQQEELDNLNENFETVAKLPVVISDHRLSIDIITPDQEHTLSAAKYDTIDRRLISRVLGALTVASSGQRNESTLTVARGVARLLENRRHMMKRDLEMHIARKVIEANPHAFEGEPNMAFTPRNVQLDADSQIVQAVLALRTQKELSRETVLEFFGFDQSVEAVRREYEESSGMDDIFKTQVPFAAGGMGGDSEEPRSSQVDGARGGRPVGGGDTKQSPGKQARPRTGNGNTTKEN